jgi:bacteriorhodopsin
MISGDDFRNLITILPADGLTIEDLAARIANLFLTVAGIIAFVYLIYAGILYITAGGSADQAKKAQTAVVNVIIGVLVIMFSYAIIRSVGNLARLIVQ